MQEERLRNLPYLPHIAASRLTHSNWRYK